ncbi:ATP-binding protein [Paenalkalicoccus suaedae]|uniref:ATP-binding protein n=1 Tax=Paenalkalicoccus suaedae TaxID=2592382 RepID=A0A859FCL7_9BACI|nr:ATP-binding protein [Paenalkalicoccus suaedae]QKS70005.1 ATP-binding protein [Paenalkalicoccus suaedae]
MDSFLFNKSNTRIKDMINYREHAVALEGVSEHLFTEFGHTFYQFSLQEELVDIWKVLQDDIKHNANVEFVTYVFESVEAFKVTTEIEEDRLRVNSNLNIDNSVYYYPDFEVALVRIPIFREHMNYEQSFVFSTSQTAVKRFLHYVYKQNRIYSKAHMSMLIDTLNGVEERREQITTAVLREDVLLEAGLKEEIYRSIDQFFLEDGSFFKTYDIPYKRGILLYGHPGNGKTTLVKSIAGSVEAPVVYWQITEHTSSYTVMEVFQKVAKLTPMVLVIEDLDSMPLDVRSVFLNTLDGSTSKEGVFLVGTTNYPEKIDPALVNRAGRFDRSYELKLPGKELRSQYAKVKRFDRFLTEDQVELLVEKTDGLSFAQLNELYTSAALQWHYEEKVDIDELCSQLQNDNRKKKRDEWNESNHDPVGFY